MDNDEVDNFVNVVKAFKSAAQSRGVKGAKLGQLVSFLASMPAEERRAYILPMADDPEALFEYVQIGYDKAQGVASGSQNSASISGAGTWRVQSRLLDSAAKLLKQESDINGTLWELAYGDSSCSYVDEAGVVDRVRWWAKVAIQEAARDRRESSCPPPLLISGLVKTGKSYTLEHIVPAVVAEALCEQQQAEDGGGRSPLLANMVVLRLKGDELECSGGATGMLRKLLRKLVQWARTERVPVLEGALATAEADLLETDMGILGDAIHCFIEAMEVPVLVLCDEVQSLFLPTICGELDVNGVEYIRNRFMKQLLVGGPRTVLWCLTGSSMAHTWTSVAKMPPNGHCVIVSHTAVHLPATYSAAHMEWAWQRLQQVRYPHVVLDRRLLELCPRSVALLVVLVNAWVTDGCPSDAEAFLCDFVRLKVIDESLREWKVGLETMPLSQRLTILDLSVPAVGADTRKQLLHTGLQTFLQPHLDKTVDGRCYLRDSHQRQIVRLLFNNDGSLRRERWGELGYNVSLTQLDSGWNLFYLGEAADYLLGLEASRRWQQLAQPLPAGTDAFEAKLQVIADGVANKLRAAEAAAGGAQQQQQQQQQQPQQQPQPGGGVELNPQELWERQPWFQKVLNSKWNELDLKAHLNNKQARHTHLAMLVFYLRLSRKALGHAKPWDRAAGAILDVDIVEALPGALGQPLFDVNEAMVEALRLVSGPTFEAAAAVFAAELSGSVAGGGGLSSGEGGDGSTSRGGGRGGSRGGGGQGRGARAVHDRYTCPPSGPAAAVCGQRPPLAYTASVASGSRVGWGKGGQRAATLAPSRHLRLPLVAQVVPAAAVAMGSRLLRGC